MSQQDVQIAFQAGFVTYELEDYTDGKHMKEKNQIVAYIMITPFVVSASAEFLPRWISAPIGMLGVMIWMGALFMLLDKKND